MNRDLSLSPSTYGLAAGAFSLGAALGQVPSNIMLLRLGAPTWLARLSVAWGLTAAAFAFVRSPAAFVALRLLLGICEVRFRMFATKGACAGVLVLSSSLTVVTSRLQWSCCSRLRPLPLLHFLGTAGWLHPRRLGGGRHILPSAPHYSAARGAPACRHVRCPACSTTPQQPPHVSPADAPSIAQHPAAAAPRC